MTSSETLVTALKGFEGCKLYAYRDSVGVATIGYGTTKNVKMGMAITLKQAEKLLREDLQVFERYVNNLKVCTTQGQFDALVDFAYNLGTGNLGSSTLLKKIKAGVNSATLSSDYAAIPLSYFGTTRPQGLNKSDMYKHIIQYQFSRWNKAGGKVLPGLTKRRQWEGQRFFQ